MAFVVISYPTVSEKDQSWIQSIRSKYDSHYQMVAPHFTLIFPCLLENSEELIQHIKRKTKRTRRTPFIISNARTFKDVLSENFHLFLIPAEGSDSIMELHDILYTDFLAGELRPDIPFVPHITIGNGPSPKQLEKLAEGLNRGKLNIKGSIDILDIAFLEESSVKTLERVSLE